ncbi:MULTISPECIES: N-methyl-L-tryptophan oxidase [unclassified Micromonospora]|uniref:N-methyl-L-tryptophan oxidase n=1 Tax=unclassified Micromonospora TaxID=2617518 RepID=UPI001C5CF72A|nr:N-methyl-L-tryptophan oxidase [Micromonospora sp. RL09-050-HVF-A]MBW4702629.1 N-methyl-L-tryptophan oxidase [Micromonospora sp. RL09-050-HVF-A]
MSPTYDVVVVGLGIMGASALHQLSRRGARVLGVEAHGPLHDLGSSHGQTRIFRRAYWEGEQYVPLLDSSYEGWWELDAATDETIALRTGGLFVGSPDSKLVQGSRDTALRCGINHEYLDAGEITSRFPAFHVQPDAVAVHEPDALMLFADNARLTYLTRATAAGAHLVHGRAVRTLSPGSGGTVTVVGDGWEVSCGAVVLTVGGWVGRFLPGEIAPAVTPMRIPVFEFDVAEARERDHLPGRFPAFLYEDAGGALVYGLPRWRSVDGGLKIGFHNRQLSPQDVDGDRRPPSDAERHELWRTISPVLPAVQPTGRGRSCIYTMSTDESFLIGRSRELDGVCYASACSGHGFKFAPGIGEVLAQLALDGRSTVDISAFSPDRL